MPGHSHVRESPWYFPLQTLLLAEFLQQPRLNSTRQASETDFGERNRARRKSTNLFALVTGLEAELGDLGWIRKELFTQRVAGH